MSKEKSHVNSKKKQQHKHKKNNHTKSQVNSKTLDVIMFSSPFIFF